MNACALIDIRRDDDIECPLTLNREERLHIPGMIPMRVDMIVVASTLIDFILRYVPVDSMTCSHYALKEGAISTLLKQVTTS